jgi:hypothetical protein
MFEMFKSSTLLFLQGKLFRDNTAVFKQWLIGFALTCAVLVAVAWLTSLVIGVIVASLVGGAAQPYLFKNLKYA